MAPGHTVARIGPRNRGGERLRRAADQVFDGENNLRLRQGMVNRRKRSQLNDDRCQILVRHAAKSLVRHDGKQRAPVVANAFAHSTRDLVIRPVSRAGLKIGGEIRRHDPPGQVDIGKGLACGLLTGQDGCSGRGPIVLGMTEQATADRSREILPTRQTLRRALESPLSQRPRLRTEEG